jgi:hypothetical protein
MIGTNADAFVAFAGLEPGCVVDVPLPSHFLMPLGHFRDTVLALPSPRSGAIPGRPRSKAAQCFEQMKDIVSASMRANALKDDMMAATFARSVSSTRAAIFARVESVKDAFRTTTDYFHTFFGDNRAALLDSQIKPSAHILRDNIAASAIKGIVERRLKRREAQSFAPALYSAKKAEQLMLLDFSADALSLRDLFPTATRTGFLTTPRSRVVNAIQIIKEIVDEFFGHSCGEAFLRLTNNVDTLFTEKPFVMADEPVVGAVVDRKLKAFRAALCKIGSVDEGFEYSTLRHMARDIFHISADKPEFHARLWEALSHAADMGTSDKTGNQGRGKQGNNKRPISQLSADLNADKKSKNTDITLPAINGAEPCRNWIRGFCTGTNCAGSGPLKVKRPHAFGKGNSPAQIDAYKEAVIAKYSVKSGLA